MAEVTTAIQRVRLRSAESVSVVVVIEAEYLLTYGRRISRSKSLVREPEQEHTRDMLPMDHSGHGES